MMRRRPGGLVRTVGRTAVVAGTASAVAGGVSRRQSRKQAEAQQEQATSQQAAYEQGLADAQAAPPPQPAPNGTGAIAELQKLGEMKSQGLLTDEEFAAAKAKLLGT